LLKTSPIPSRQLRRYARNFTRRILRYNWWLFVHSQPPHWRYALLQWVVKILGPQSWRILARF
jgi:hypothetical protein